MQFQRGYGVYFDGHSGTPLASQMLNQLKLCWSLGYFYFDFAGGPGRKTNTVGSHVISFVSPSDTQETFFIQFEVLRGGKLPQSESELGRRGFFLVFQLLVVSC